MSEFRPAAIRRSPPAQLLAAVREGRARGGAHLEAVLRAWGLRPLSGGRNNDVFAWDTGDGEIGVMVFRSCDRDRAAREWHGLAHLDGRGCAPAALWWEDHPSQPAVGMTLLPGVPLLDAGDLPTGIAALAATVRAMQAVPLSGPLARIARVDSIGHYIARLTDVWPAQLAEAAGDPTQREMLVLLRRWERSGDAELLARPAPCVFSRGDANLLNWLRHGQAVFVVDFEYSGYSDAAVDAADHVEHISSRAVPDRVWADVADELGAGGDRATRARFAAARRTIALRWLAVLWRQRGRRAAEFAAQLERVRSLGQ
jgi:hypothetical protein